MLSTPAIDNLAKNPTYQAALAELPSEHGFTMYVDIKQLATLAEAAAAMEMGGGFKDASEKCSEYASQEAAQEAFDADPATNWELDQDFDGQACEDYFVTEQAQATPEISAEQLSKIAAFAMVGYQDGAMTKTSSILLIEE